MAYGSWLMAKKNLSRGPGPGGPRGKFFIGHEPDAMSTTQVGLPLGLMARHRSYIAEDTWSPFQ